MTASLTAYLPMDRRRALSTSTSLPDRMQGAALSADISGFTPLTVALAEELGPQRGAEELTRRLNKVYGALIGEVHRFGGSVIGFSGDAITCWFDGDNGSQAASCALAMQEAMGQFAKIMTPGGTDVSFALKIAAVAGSVRRFLVGDPQRGLMEVLAGRILEEMAAAEQEAKQGEVLVGESIVHATGGRMEVCAWREMLEKERRFAVVHGLSEAVEAAPWPEGGMIDEADMRGWLLPPVYERLKSGQGEFLAELRQAVALFLRFQGIVYDEDDDAGTKLDGYVRWVQSVLGRYEGYLIQLTMGDKGSYLYAVFGAPIAHEEDAARAVAAALTLLSPPSELSFIRDIQIGIARGQMRTGAYGSMTRRTYGVLGDKTNLAARLMEVAEPGQIRCDHEVHRRTETQFEYEALLPVRVKGKAGLIRVYRPVGVAGRISEVTVHEPAIVGRTAELARLEAALDTVEGGEPRILIIEGEAGIGKSRLVQELVRLMRERGLTGLLGEGRSIEHQTPYRAWRDVFSSYFDVDEVTDPAEREQWVRDVVDEVAPDQLERLPLLNTILNIALPETRLTASLDPALRRQSLIMLLVSLLRGWAKERPLILVLDDAHWLDSLSWELAIQSARAFSTYSDPVLLVIITRPMDEGALGNLQLGTLRGTGCTETLHLSTLSPEETMDLVTARLSLPKGGLKAPLVGMICRRSEGNPFFAEELVCTMRDQGLIRVKSALDGSARFPGVVDVDSGEISKALPDTLRGLILSRIDRLSPEKQLTLKVAAVIGRSFGYGPLRHTLNRHVLVAEKDLKAQLDDLNRRDLTVLEAREPNLTYAFKHAVTHEVAYQTLLYDQRRRLHRIVAEWFESTFSDSLEPYLPILAYHYQKAEDPDREQHYCRMAGEQAVAEFANMEAVRYLSRALDLTPESDLAGRYALLLARQRVHDLQGEREAQHQDIVALEGLAEALSDDERRAEAALRKAHWAETTGDYQASRTAARMAIGLAQASQAASHEAAGYLQVGQILRQQGDHRGAKMQFEQALALAQTAQLRQWEANSLRSLGAASFYLGDYADAESFFQQALRIYRKIGDRLGEARALNPLGLVPFQQGDYIRAKACYEQALNSSRKIGDRRGERFVLNNIGLISVGQGDYVEAKALFEQALDISREIGDRRGEGLALNNFALVTMHVGDHDGTQSCVTQALHIFREIDDRHGESIALANLSQLSHHLKDDEAAYEYGKRALLIAEEIGNRHAWACVLAYLGQAQAGLGHLTDAADAYGQALALGRELSESTLIMEILAGLSRVLLAQGNPTQALTRVEKILAHLETDSLDGAEEPFKVYLTCYRVLLANQDPRAWDILKTAYSLLQQEAARITDEEMRLSFLENVAAHREIVEEFVKEKRTEKSDQVGS